MDSETARILMIQRQDLHCTNCGRHVVFDMDFDLDGNHEITCPECGHVHYRVVQNGLITEERWNSSMPTFMVTMSTATTLTAGSIMYYSAGTSTGTGDAVGFLYDAWLQTT